MSSHQMSQSREFTNEYKSVAPKAARSIGLFSLFGLMRQRRALKRMDAAQLQDLGLSREQADAEAARPFWDVPTTWRNNSRSPAISRTTRGRRS